MDGTATQLVDPMARLCRVLDRRFPKRERAGVALVNRPNLLHGYRQLTNCEAKRRGEVK
jgi:hypothetical protein